MSKLLIIEIKNPAMSLREGVSAKGKDYSIATQQAWVHNGDDYPLEFPLSLQTKDADGKKLTPVPFPPGRYLLAAGSLNKPKRDEYNFTIGVVQLVSLDAARAELPGGFDRPAAAKV